MTTRTDHGPALCSPHPVSLPERHVRRPPSGRQAAHTRWTTRGQSPSGRRSITSSGSRISSIWMPSGSLKYSESTAPRSGPMYGILVASSLAFSGSNCSSGPRSRCAGRRRSSRRSARGRGPEVEERQQVAVPDVEEQVRRIRVVAILHQLDQREAQCPGRTGSSARHRCRSAPCGGRRAPTSGRSAGLQVRRDRGGLGLEIGLRGGHRLLLGMSRSPSPPSTRKRWHGHLCITGGGVDS